MWAICWGHELMACDLISNFNNLTQYAAQIKGTIFDLQAFLLIMQCANWHSGAIYMAHGLRLVTRPVIAAAQSVHIPTQIDPSSLY